MLSQQRSFHAGTHLASKALLYLVTALVASLTACLASSPGRVHGCHQSCQKCCSLKQLLLLELGSRCSWPLAEQHTWSSGAGVLGDGLGALAHCVLGQLSRQGVRLPSELPEMLLTETAAAARAWLQVQLATS